MEALVGLIIFGSLFVGSIALVASLIFPGSGKKRSTVSSLPWQPPESEPRILPYVRKQYVFSASERSFYEILRRLVDGHAVFPKMRLCDVVNVKKGSGEWQSHFNRINRKHVDFIVCNFDLAPVIAIELDDASHDREDRKERDGFVDSALAAAGLPLVRVRAQRSYVLDDIQKLLAPYISLSAPAPQFTGH